MAEISEIELQPSWGTRNPKICFSIKVQSQDLQKEFIYSIYLVTKSRSRFNKQKYLLIYEQKFCATKEITKFAIPIEHPTPQMGTQENKFIIRLYQMVAEAESK